MQYEIVRMKERESDSVRTKLMQADDGWTSRAGTVSAARPHVARKAGLGLAEG